MTNRAVLKRADKADEYFWKEGCYILEMSNSNDDPDQSVARSRVLPGDTTRWHSLEGVMERYVIISGEGVVEVGDDPPYTVIAGDVILIPAGVRQRIHNSGDTELVFLCLCTPRFQADCYRALE